MASSSFSISTMLLAITFINNVVVTAIPETEYHSMLGALRFRGYNLFANAITTTDLHYDIINGDNFTFFAPTDSSLYALDMSLSAADYTIVLRFHCVPHRLSLTDLRSLVFGSNSVPTLIPGHEIHVVNPLTLRSPIMVEGVDIAFPGLFYGVHIAVHGLEGVMDFRSLRDAINSSSVAVNLTEDHTPMNAMNDHRESYAPASETSVPVSVTESGASPVVSMAHRIYVTGAQKYHQSETALKSITQPRWPVTKSESVEQPRLPETRSESITQPSPVTYSETITQPREEHVSITTRSALRSQKIHGVSLARASIGDFAEEFTQVDDRIVDCSIAADNDNDDDEDDSEDLHIGNKRHGDLYMRELYTPTKMICAQN
ncbi:hypothetical protein QVD17_26772 [Tagetes erecta]|uniref:FAS1 domain-containing protein n=1 Tax=Tagetes erecta TaxID=13708 RepID=A0AAD8KBM1_TARER|nr:hypothetical protein QVD17_26772 [Tagetes erecta]